MVLSLANARNLIINLRRLYYLQLGLWHYPVNYTQKLDNDPGLPTESLPEFAVHFHYRHGPGNSSRFKFLSHKLSLKRDSARKLRV